MVNTNICFTRTSYNKFINLDAVETRIVNYLRDTHTPEAERIWKLLKYSDMKALFYDNLSQEDKESLIYKDVDQDAKRVFTFPYIEDNFVATCSILKIYIHSITPVNHLISNINIGIDILSHNKLANVYNDAEDVEEGGRRMEEGIMVKNRNTVLLKSVLNTLNGADIRGVGMLQFNHQLSEQCTANLKLTNNRDFYGYTVILSGQLATLGGAQNG